ncbi:MAG: exopolyphosphatase [Peptococcaceae bacterium]
MEKKIAIIDLGSNSVRMIIMKVYEDKTYKMIEQEKEMVRLSEGMGKDLILKAEPIQRTLNTLRLFKKLIEAHNVADANIIAVATAAVRKAGNRDIFIELVEKSTGLKLTILSGKEEAYFGYLGVINSIAVDNCLIVDIGGASTEMVWVVNRQIKESTSLPYGAVVLSETFLGKDEASPEKMQKLETFLHNRLSAVSWLKKAVKLPIIGIGGTIRTLAKIDKRKNAFPLENLHNYHLSAEEFFTIYEQIITSSLETRKKIPGLDKNRADIIAGGLALVKTLLQLQNTSQLIISGNGLREGLFYHKYLQEIHYPDRIITNVLEHSLENILKTYDIKIKHSFHVQKLALSLFDQTQSLHELGPDARKLLAAGALLHDIGTYVDYYNHHKHGFYLIQNSRIYGLRIKEILMCAFIVAMHRDLEFKKNWKTYGMLISREDYEVIKKLSLFVRIAENLDRNEFESIDRIHCTISEKTVKVELLTGNTPELELAAAMKSAKEFKKLFKKNLQVCLTKIN